MKDNRQNSRRIGVLVCEAFHGPRPAGHYALHNDGDRSNNRSSNLRWGTPKENSEDAIAHGAIARGEKHPQAKLTDDQVRAFQADARAGGYTAAKLAEKYGISIHYAYKLRGYRREATRLHHPDSYFAERLRAQGDNVSGLPECG